MSEPYIRLKNICKSFGTVQANKNVSIDVSKGEILALLGENGSGKSTLVNMLSGIYTPDSGEIEHRRKAARNGVDYRHMLRCLYDRVSRGWRLCIWYPGCK